MSPNKSVLGVLGVCRVDIAKSTQVKVNEFGAKRALCRVCWVCARARACDVFFDSFGEEKNLYARTYKPNKPNTLNTNINKRLVLKSFSCVGFVSGSQNSVLGLFSKRKRG
jgi:hypothetical protein